MFHTASGSIAQIDAAMTRQQWRPRPPKGGSAVREYEPAEDTYGGYEWLYASDDGSGTKWELDVAADPADNPADSC